MKSLAIIVIALLVIAGCCSKPSINPNPILVQPSARAIARLATVSLSPGIPVTLAWDKSPDTNAVSYRIYWGVSAGLYTNSIAVGTNLTATITNLTAGVKYFFAATAANSLGVQSDFSSEALWTATATSATVELVVFGQHADNPVGPWTNFPQPIYRGPPTNMQFFRTVANMQTNVP